MGCRKQFQSPWVSYNLNFLCTEAKPWVFNTEKITSFVHHLRKIYRYENTYHNFEHALDVLQATQSYLKSGGIVPPPTFLLEPPDRKWTSPKSINDGKLLATLGHRELFILYVAAIGHDVGHPGFTNNFMVRLFRIVRC